MIDRLKDKRNLIYIIPAAVVAAAAIYAEITREFISKNRDEILNPIDLLPRLPLGDGVDALINWLRFNIGLLTRMISDTLSSFMDSFSSFLLEFPPFVELTLPFLVIILITLLAWRFSDYKIALFTLAGLTLIYNMELWPHAVDTITMILIAVLISICIGLPVGILTTRSDTFHRIVWPILDFMQTMPAFVYLIPAVFFFRLGVVSAMIATVVFSMPPVIRLTGLGIRQVPKEVVEAATAFGSTSWQKLTKVQLPLAKPTIMAGINQCIMLALSMVVIAAMIGAGGLGGEVLRGIQRLRLGLGFESGLAVVIVAIILDRITQSSRQKAAAEEE